MRVRIGEDVMMETEAGVKHFEDGGRSHQPRWPQEAEKGQEMDSPPRSLQKEPARPHLDFSPGKLISDS